MSPVRSTSPAVTRRSRTPAIDPIAAEAVDLARAAAEDTSRPEFVGDHLGMVPEGDRVVTHYFTCLDPAYHGWRWAISVVRASRAKHATVNESVLLPGEDAMLAPEWVPWSDRLRPGDLGPGDLLPTTPDDPRLAPGFTQTDEVDAELGWELGLGKPRVLSAEGRDEAAIRWYGGDAGPETPVARSAPAQCGTCGFFAALAGSLRQAFGVCANEYAPDDGKVVSVDHGCGAHSEAVVLSPTTEAAPPIVDEMGYDVMPSATLTDEEALGHS
ncbi:DUF3027 domain-containing protein [Actinoallomurus purpureus]|uniref:DUF3027 domain-containing protein n=1 Tax=Actinoallomurus purpureus TaxID=478114 RepID=UPI0020939E99|nr:DUF3027 domain-containing protein [Actinoallomurus purpureus]MCO6010928.1 DUF3027 domain-containing protein [Actinoallomurus purpureus]